MRNNQPVTSTERRLEADQKLISSTDLHGKIVHCNDDFVAVSGFSREELIGQPHNLVRHPDMPPQAFAEMWADLKAGRPWMGMVKNRCKNGDFYWVSAYVTPVFSEGEIVGYESVRTCPARELVDRAEKVYRGLRSGSWERRARLRRTARSAALPVGIILFTLLGYGLNGINGAFQGAALATILSLVMTAAVYRRSLVRLSELTEGYFKRDLAAQIYHGKEGPVRQIAMAMTSQNERVGSILSRILDAAGTVSSHASESLAQSKASHGAIKEQQVKSQGINQAMDEISSAIRMTSKNISETAVNSVQVQTLVKSGTMLASTTHQSIESLSGIADHVADSVNKIQEETTRISQAAKVIEDIAEQTNLLALNAAIESARAGEQGRGFAVVADEVRTLAQRTQQTTSSIHHILLSLEETVGEAVSVASGGSESASVGLSKVNEMELMLQSIAIAVDDIARMSDAMAMSSARQAELTVEMQEKVGEVSTFASHSLERSQLAADTIIEVGRLSTELRDLVDRFR